MSVRTALGIATAAATGVAAYAKWVRPRQLTRGVTPEEVDRSLSGDAVGVRPTLNATRAVSIKAQFVIWTIGAGQLTLRPVGDRPTGSAAVSVSTVVDVEHVDDAVAVVDAIADPVLAPSRAPLAGERCAQRCADAVWVVRQWAEQELHAGCSR